MTAVRPYLPGDLDDIVELCLRATRRRYTDHELLPDVLVRPYLAAEPDMAFVAEDSGRVVGYVLGVRDTVAFADWFAQTWLPSVGHRHPLPQHEPRTLQDHWTVSLHTPRQWLVREELKAYPAHLHIDILPAHRRQGLGRALMTRFIDALREQGVPALHVSYLTENIRAAAFYARMGFKVINIQDTGVATCAGRSTTADEPVVAGADG